MNWYVVKNGEIMFRGTEQECIEMIREDMTGELEIYSKDGRAKEMTNEMAKRAIVKRIEELQGKNRGIAQSREYQIGVMNGMLKAFFMAGIINAVEDKEIFDELFEEYF